MTLRVLSLGAGVQSSTLALMAERGEIARPDCAIFADTQGEPVAVYEWLAWLESQLSFPVHRVTRGSLWESASTPKRTRDGERTYIPTGIPVFLAEGLRRGIGRRQCTRTFKIEPIEQKLRELLGRTRITARDGVLVTMLVGISLDEADRMKPSRQVWITTEWPLIDLRMTRADCLRWMRANGYPEPPRSACTFCPFRDNDSWRALSDVEFADVVKKEHELQAAYRATSEMRGVPYFHSSRVPLAQVNFDDETVAPRAQLSLFRNECEGMCGV